MKKLLSFVMTAVLLLGAVMPAFAAEEPTALEASGSKPVWLADAEKIDVSSESVAKYNEDKYGMRPAADPRDPDFAVTDYWIPTWAKDTALALIPADKDTPKMWRVPITVDTADTYTLCFSIMNWDKSVDKPDGAGRKIDVTVAGKTYRLAESATIARGVAAYFTVTAELTAGTHEIVFATCSANGTQCYLYDVYYAAKSVSDAAGGAVMEPTVTLEAKDTLPEALKNGTKISMTDPYVIGHNESKYNRVEGDGKDFMYKAYVWTTYDILTTANTYTVPVKVDTAGEYTIAFSILNTTRTLRNPDKTPRVIEMVVGTKVFRMEESAAYDAGMPIYFTATVNLAAGENDILLNHCGSAAYLLDLYVVGGAIGGSGVVGGGGSDEPNDGGSEVTSEGLEAFASLPADVKNATVYDLSDPDIVSYNETKYDRVNADGEDFNAAYTWGKAKEWTAVTTANTYTVPVSVDKDGTYTLAVSILNITRNINDQTKTPRAINVSLGDTTVHIEESPKLHPNVKAYYTFTAELKAGENEVNFIYCGSAAYLLDLYVADGKGTVSGSDDGGNTGDTGNTGGDTGSQGGAVVPTEPVPTNVTPLTASASLPASLTSVGKIDLGSTAVIEYNVQKFGYKTAADPTNPDFSKTDYWIPTWADHTIALIPVSANTAKQWIVPIDVKQAGTYEFAVSIFNHSKHQGNADDEKAKARQIDVTVAGKTYRLSESDQLAQNTEAYFTFTATLEAGKNEIVISTCTANGLQCYLLDLYTNAIQKAAIDDGINRLDPLTELPFEFAGCDVIDLGDQAIIDYNVEKYGYQGTDDPTNPDFTTTDYWIPKWASDVIAVIPKSSTTPIVWSVPVEIEDAGTYGFAVSIYNWNRTQATPTDRARQIEATVGGVTYRMEESAEIARGAAVYFVMYADLTAGTHQIDISTCTANGLQCYLLDLSYTMTGSDDPYDPAIESTWPDTDEEPEETDAPETDAPETDAPETDAPETDAPETDAPETDAPETDAPETDAPETDAPETDAPDTGDAEDPKGNGGATGLVIGAVAAVVVIGAVVAVVLKKKKK